MILSGGVLKKSVEYFTPSSWNGYPQPGITLAHRWGSYSAIYRRDTWVSTLVNKIANATARLPLKVYERAEAGRPEARDHPYARLLRRPSSEIDSVAFWVWVRSTVDIYGEAFLLKGRDKGGQPNELVRCIPTRMHDEEIEGRVQWSVDTVKGRVDIARRDFVHFKLYNPDSLRRGMSPLEPLRATLENEEGARRANSAMWKNGARPSVLLRHPQNLSTPAQQRLRANWEQVYAGVDNWSKAAILEEGMEAQVLSLDVKDLEYVAGRKLNHEEYCALYDVPPPVVHILDRATFSNVTEQMRSMYRDTMAPKLKFLESTLEMELRDGSFGTGRPPDFGEEVYAEFLMDEVLRGDFETRVDSYQKGVNSGWVMPSEVREMENLPFVEGSDVLLVNGALVPLDKVGETPVLPELPPSDEEEEPVPGEPEPPPAVEEQAQRQLSTVEARTIAGRLSRQSSLADVDPVVLTEGLNGKAAFVLDLLTESRSLADLRQRILAFAEEDH